MESKYKTEYCNDFGHIVDALIVDHVDIESITAADYLFVDQCVRRAENQLERDAHMSRDHSMDTISERVKALRLAGKGNTANTRWGKASMTPPAPQNSFAQWQAVQRLPYGQERAMCHLDELRSSTPVSS
eukprot:TRINITY_DN2460_c0_g1_i1.p1 TRINITY_DN2460_c0_g1~~TRINITY_DN2460_c0_g1_i1.p1  ORF type:complete len:130 (+),score=20.99 TRINITY_DN2460_c0_g1_i1:230-619(+)